MQKVVEILMEEHRLIERVLGSLESFRVGVEGGLRPERPLVADYAAFFRGFADAYHHGKEEDILFQRLIERGFSRDSGPVAVMLHEHRVGRAHVAALRQLGGGTGEIEDAERLELLTHGSDFVALLRQHILKEDRILYPMALQVLTGPELDVMETEFEAFEKRLEGEGARDRLVGLADRLVASFPPDPERLAMAAAGPACGSR